MSIFIPFILFSIEFPKCFPRATHGRGFPHNVISGRGLSLCKKAKHLVLHLDGSGSVLNVRLCNPAYSSQIFSISCNESTEGASKKESSEYPNIYSKKEGIYPTASSIPSENLKKVVYIETVQDCTQDRALANAIGQTEDTGEGAVPANISKLVDIDEDEESYKDCRKTSCKQFLE